MAHLSLSERAQVIRARFQYDKLTPSTLFNLYKAAKIKYVKPSYSYLAKNKKRVKIMALQKDFVELISALRMKGELVIYLDETTFHAW